MKLGGSWHRFNCRKINLKMNTSDQRSEQQKHLENLQAVAAHIAQRSERAKKPAQQEAKAGKFTAGLRRWGPLGIVLALVLGKFKWLVMLAKFAKLPTLLTMVVAVAAYASIWGIPFALGFVLLIFVHELGHVLVMRQQGIPAGAPVFIPFVGAVIAMKGRPRDAYVEALVGIGGPALGTAATILCLILGWLTRENFWFALASTGFLINLFNMIPISPLDGGRIAGVISQWLWGVGLAIGVIVFINTKSPLLFLILLLGVYTLFKNIRRRADDYYNVDLTRRISIAALYFGLLAVMAIGMWLAEKPLQGLR
jgi:Zn-dependent protease